MGSPPFASLALWTLAACAWRRPSRCPYCPYGSDAHWSRWGRYWRYAADSADPSRLIPVPRCRCKITLRTFSLLPDSLLPYHGWRTAHVLQMLYAMFVHDIPVSTLARRVGLGRGSLRYLKQRFLRAVSVLRLPDREGALAAGAFMARLAGMQPAAIADLFRGWKEREPKHSVVGIYLRC